MALGQDRSIVLVGFAAMRWLVIRDEVPANQRDRVTLLLGTPRRDGIERGRLPGAGLSSGSMQKNAAMERVLARR